MKFILSFILTFGVLYSVNANNFSKFFGGEAKGQLWAVLVAGSAGWSNYRHQADVCHAYQVLHNHGIPDERIIVFMKDDIANNHLNPTPGIIINHPQGADVYKGVPHDYTGNAVQPKNFLAVLRGDKAAISGIGSGKILESGPNDHVFVYFSDHGAPGVIEFPDEELSAGDLNKTIQYMYTNKKYGKMVIYIEACESGSMFENLLPDNINVYATTAANSEESSRACYYDDQREAFLGDVYSVKWLEDSDQEILTKETLHQQYEIVKKETLESHVQEFGDLNIAKMHVSEFQGRKIGGTVSVPKVELDPVRSRDVPIEIMKRKQMSSNSDVEKSEFMRKLNKMLRNRMFLQNRVSEIVTDIFHDDKKNSDILTKHYKLTNYECYDTLRHFFNKECFQLSKNPYALDFMYVFVNLCEKKVSISRVKSAMERVCIHPHLHGIV